MDVYTTSSFVVCLFLAIMCMLGGEVCCTSTEGEHFEGRTNERITEWYRQIHASSSIDCCAICSRESACRSVNFQRFQLDCQLSNVSHRIIDNYITADNDTDVFMSKAIEHNKVDTRTPQPACYKHACQKKDNCPRDGCQTFFVTTIALSSWDLVFRGTPGTSTDPFIAYRDAVNVATDDISCQQITPTDCSLHYRNPIIDDWDNLAVSQAKYAYYKDGQEAAYVIFNAVGRGFKGWFKDDYVLASSWPDMVGKTFDRFSMAGLTRRFVMNLDLTSSCDNNLSYGFSMNADLSCPVDEHANYPQFLYALTETASKMSNVSAFQVADCVAIYIR